MSEKLFRDLRPIARDLPESGIVELANAGREKEGLIPLWTGEGHLPTPDFICNAAYDAMKRGETFYTWQRGIPELREALANYHARHFNRSFAPEQFFVTGSGMQAVQIAMTSLLGAGDEVIIPTPAWPNFAAAAEIAGASVVEVPMREPSLAEGRGWMPDLGEIEAAISKKTRVLFINTPSNPTGWTASLDDLVALLEICRRHDIWIMADEVYNRFYYGDHAVDGRAPSFYDIMTDEDKIIFVNTFSKNWAMTGWRIGWIAASPRLGQVYENLIQFSTSGVASFLQPAAKVALDEGDDFVKSQVTSVRKSREVICDALAATDGVNFAKPDGAFYLLFSIKGLADTRAIALRMIDEALVGFAPGSAFGKSAESYLRMCFARDPNDIKTASDRLTRWLVENT